MALNIAVPMSSVGNILDGFGLLSPISPVNIDFRDSIKNPLSPVGSESSGVSSLDLEDIKMLRYFQSYMKAFLSRMRRDILARCNMTAALVQ
uniref:Uncharacterized protein n=1 Tax=Anopheles epiroticus TaxID=199890 RepID=A0A182PUV0_9DIPT